MKNSIFTRLQIAMFAIIAIFIVNSAFTQIITPPSDPINPCHVLVVEKDSVSADQVMTWPASYRGMNIHFFMAQQTSGIQFQIDIPRGVEYYDENNNFYYQPYISYRWNECQSVNFTDIHYSPYDGTVKGMILFDGTISGKFDATVMFVFDLKSFSDSTKIDLPISSVIYSYPDSNNMEHDRSVIALQSGSVLVMPRGLPGDVNYDLKNSVSDVAMQLKTSSGKLIFTPMQIFVGDLNGDGLVTSWDARLNAFYVNSSITCFPVDLFCYSGSGKDIKSVPAVFNLNSGLNGILYISSDNDTLTNGDWTMEVPIDAIVVPNSQFVQSVNDRIENGIRKISVSFFSYINIQPGQSLVTISNTSAELIKFQGSINMGQTVVLKNHIGTTGINDDLKSIPKEYSLNQNYPNPFNPMTNISFSIPEQGFVKLNVFNVLGEEVATLVNEERPAGNYEVSFDASGIPSGLYFYRLQAGSYIKTNKMVLMK